MTKLSADALNAPENKLFLVAEDLCTMARDIGIYGPPDPEEAEEGLVSALRHYERLIREGRDGLVAERDGLKAEVERLKLQVDAATERLMEARSIEHALKRAATQFAEIGAVKINLRTGAGLKRCEDDARAALNGRPEKASEESWEEK